MSSMINTSGTNDNVARWIWENLVPKSGQAESVQGELLRAIEKLRLEAQENGNINWDEGFDLFVEFLQTTLTLSSIAADAKASILQDLARLQAFQTPSDAITAESNLPYVDDDLYDRLTDHVVEFARKNPNLIPLKKDSKQYR